MVFVDQNQHFAPPNQLFRPFLEFVSPIADGSIPCYEDGVDDAYVSTRLSCLAAENEIFIAANYATVVDGNSSFLKGCSLFY